MSDKIKFVFFLLSTVILINIFNQKISFLPPLGKFLNPYTGYLALVNSDELPENKIFNNLNNSVEIIWDDRRIPHIFSNNEHDLFFTQGFIHAYERLWQMEFQLRAVAGRLSEIIGEDALQFDKFQRRIGMVRGTDEILKLYQSDKEMITFLNDYTDGVNAFIKSLKPKYYPLEYKILDYSPELWTLEKCVLLYMYMAWELSGSTNDISNTKFVNMFGLDEYEKLFNFKTDLLAPIIPKGTKWEFNPINVKAPENIYMSDSYSELLEFQPNDNNGSNNFAITGSKTKSGNAILANDPHLNLTLPSIWYENHLIHSDYNVYGVSLLGVPSVVIGFNENIAWGSTNGMNDVMDFYDIAFKDSSMQEYLFEDKWRSTYLDIDTIKIRNSDYILDTTIITHYGPIITHDIFTTMPRMGSGMPVGRAMKWLATKPSMEAKTFYLLNKAKDYNDYLDAINDFSCPGQNIIFASKDGDIGIWHTNELIPKWEYQGRFIMDGSASIYEWNEPAPHHHKPHSYNPDIDFLSSANQMPVDSTYPYYMPGEYAPAFRGKRIDNMLDEIKDGTYKDLQNIQNDNKSLLAEFILPTLLEVINNNISSNMKICVEDLYNWNYFYNPDTKVAIIFDKWVRKIADNTWSDELGEQSYNVEWPNYRVLAELLVNDFESKWFDNITTSEVETLEQIILKSFFSSYEDLEKLLGAYGDNWEWKNSRGTDINHLAKIPGLGNLNLPTGGDWNIPNATAKTHGPSWRYIVELGDTINAYGIYPGGQNGFPGSKFYNNFINDWVEGKLYKLNYISDITDIEGHISNFNPDEVK